MTEDTTEAVENEPTTLIGKRCGLLLNPSRLVITYQRTAYSAERRHSIPLRKFSAASEVDLYAERLLNTKRYRQYVDLVTAEQLRKLLNILQEYLSGKTMKESIDKYNTVSSPSHDLDSEENLCALSDNELDKRKDIMKTTFEANQRKQGDSDYEYDVEVDFDHGVIETCDWDEDDDDMEF